MAAFVLDTSALVKRYDVTEGASDRVASVFAGRERNVLIVASLAGVEVASALMRKVREGALTRSDADLAWRLFTLHRVSQYTVIPVAESDLSDAETLVQRHTLRAYDAVHVAVALRIARHASASQLENRFVTADRRQAAAARAEGLLVDLVAST